MKPQLRPIASDVRAEFAPYFESARQNGHFENPWDHPSLPGGSDVLRWKTQRNRLREKGYRARSLEVPRDAYSAYEAARGAATRAFWIGHASFAVELDGVRFVIDPIFGRAGGVVSRVTPAAAGPAELRRIHAVLVTHGHHDHLDPAALRALALAHPEGLLFIVPQGLGAVLPRECRSIVELDWWEYVEVEGVRVHLVPAQHWHRRGVFDLNKSLWGGFVLEGTHRVYHSGDTGYFGGFRAIGRVFGGIDLACLPLGAYEPRWFMSAQHMSPEQSVQAQLDLGATHFLGMHWAAYDLSDEPIDAGPMLAMDAADEHGVAQRLHVVVPGGSVALHGERDRTQAEVLHRWSRR